MFFWDFFVWVFFMAMVGERSGCCKSRTYEVVITKFWTRTSEQRIRAWLFFLLPFLISVHKPIMYALLLINKDSSGLITWVLFSKQYLAPGGPWYSFLKQTFTFWGWNSVKDLAARIYTNHHRRRWSRLHCLSTMLFISTSFPLQVLKFACALAKLVYLHSLKGKTIFYKYRTLFFFNPGLSWQNYVHMHPEHTKLLHTYYACTVDFSKTHLIYYAFLVNEPWTNLAFLDVTQPRKISSSAWLRWKKSLERRLLWLLNPYWSQHLRPTKTGQLCCISVAIKWDQPRKCTVY